MDPLLTIGTRFTFTSPYRIGPVGWTNEEFANRQGTEAEVTGHITEAGPAFDEEVLPMYRIRFLADGAEIEAWPEEVE